VAYMWRKLFFFFQFRVFSPKIISRKREEFYFYQSALRKCECKTKLRIALVAFSFSKRVGNCGNTKVKAHMTSSTFIIIIVTRIREREKKMKLSSLIICDATLRPDCDVIPLKTYIFRTHSNI
jgi:hypothetical protein